MIEPISCRISPNFKGNNNVSAPNNVNPASLSTKDAYLQTVNSVAQTKAQFLAAPEGAGNNLNYQA